jgi:two-component system response regulator CpxR
VDRIAQVTLEAAARRLSIEGRPLHLTTVEYEILARLVRAAGEVVARERIAGEVFDRALNPEDRSLDVHISRLRRKLGPHGSMIVTIRGVGHMLRRASTAYVIDAAAPVTNLHER